MNMTFEQWLASGDTRPYTLAGKEHTYIFLRAAKTSDFDYLYCQRQYCSGSLRRKDAFDYAGIYYKKDGLIYDSQYELQDAVKDADFYFPPDISAMRVGLMRTVRSLVEKAVSNDRRNLRISELSDAKEAERLEYYRKYRAREEARAAFLEDTPLSDIVFHCDYSADEWVETSLLEYIADPARYAEKETVAYMADHQNEMLSEFLGNDALRAEYEAILADPQLPVHFVKRIMAAVNAVSAKTVTVTICKDGESFTFKTEAGELRRDCTDHYWTWHIAAADRRGFEARFGRNAEYAPQEITCITYGKKVIYEKAEIK